jgi:hypothetical protein
MSVTIKVRGTDQWEMNVCNRNFVTLWSALGLQPETEDGLVGEIDGRVLQERVMSTEPAMVTRETQKDVGEGGATFIDMGITEEQVIRYFTGLDLLAGLACRQEDPIIWH